jgi:hypothetical protein
VLEAEVKGVAEAEGVEEKPKQRLWGNRRVNVLFDKVLYTW